MDVSGRYAETKMNLTRGLIAAVFAMFCASVKAQNKLKQATQPLLPKIGCWRGKARSGGTTWSRSGWAVDGSRWTCGTRSWRRASSGSARTAMTRHRASADVRVEGQVSA